VTYITFDLSFKKTKDYVLVIFPTQFHFFDLLICFFFNNVFDVTHVVYTDVGSVGKPSPRQPLFDYFIGKSQQNSQKGGGGRWVPGVNDDGVIADSFPIMKKTYYNATLEY